MAFENLGEKLQNVFKKLRGKGKLSEKDVKEAMREVRLALLEADVSFRVVKEFISGVTEKSIGHDVLESLNPGQQVSLNTMGVVEYRAGRYAEAIATLERSLAAGHGQYDAFDLFFLAMAHRMLGHRDQARDCYDRAVRWTRKQNHLSARNTRELAGFHQEAKVMLTDLPDDVFSQLE